MKCQQILCIIVDTVQLQADIILFLLVDVRAVAAFLSIIAFSIPSNTTLMTSH